MNEEVERLRAKKKQIHEDLADSIDREWVGLSDDELHDVRKAWWDGRQTASEMLRTLESKLKEKNT